MIHLFESLNKASQLLVGSDAIQVKRSPALGTPKHLLPQLLLAWVFKEVHYTQLAVAVSTVDAYWVRHQAQADGAGGFLHHPLGAGG